jgi:hypothetical protein
MTTMAPMPRTPQQRKQDTLHRLNHDIDAWVATADPDSGTPYLVPLSFVWDGTTLLFATPAASPTARNLQATSKARIGFDPRTFTSEYLYFVIHPERIQAWREANEPGVTSCAAGAGSDSPAGLAGASVRPVRRPDNAGRDGGLWPAYGAQGATMFQVLSYAQEVGEL